MNSEKTSDFISHPLFHPPQLAINSEGVLKLPPRFLAVTTDTGPVTTSRSECLGIQFSLRLIWFARVAVQRPGYAVSVVERAGCI